MSTSNEATWIAFPSLLTALPPSERLALENAVQAGLCGRHDDADRISTQHLAAVTTSPAYVFSRADILANATREFERFRILQEFAAEHETHGALHLLLRFMIEDCHFWLFGTVQPLLEIRSQVKEYLKEKKLEDLTDIELRCITMYYDATQNLVSNSNLISMQDRTCYSRYDGNTYAEARELRKALQEQGRLRFAPKFMQLELSRCTSSADWAQSQDVAVNMIQELRSQHQEALQYRGVVLLNQLETELTKQKKLAMSKVVHQMKELAVQQITPAGYPNWKAFCPAMAADDEKSRIISSEASVDLKYDDLDALAEDCVSSRDYSKANQIFIDIRKMLDEVHKQSQEAKIVDMMRINGKKFINFHKTTTHLAYFEAVALGDYIAFSFPNEKPYRKIVQLLLDFEARHRIMEIPSVIQRLNELGMTAARNLADETAYVHFQRLHDNALNSTSFMTQTGDYDEEMISDPNHSTRIIQAKGTDTVTCGIGAMHLMLIWAAYEVKNGQMTSEEAATVVSLSISTHPDDLESQATSCFHDICGTKDALTPSQAFMQAYEKLLHWIRKPNRKPSQATRLFTLKYLLQARLFLYREELRRLWNKVGKDDKGDDLNAKLRAIDQANDLKSTEDNALDALERLESLDPTDIDVREIQSLLTKSHLINPERPVFIEELEAGTIKCRRLADMYGRKSAYLKEYHSLTQLIRIRWQICIRLRTFTLAETDAIIKLVEEADTASDKIRSALRAPDAAAEFKAVVKSSNDFLQAEHYRYAFAALFCWYKRSTRQQAIDQLAEWSLRAKGKAIANLLDSNQLAREMTDDLNTAQVDTLAVRLREFDFTEQSRPRIVPTLKDISAMLTDDVIIVDLVDPSYSTMDPAMVALTYRKGESIRLTELPIGHSEVAGWVEENLDQESVRKEPLALPGSQAILNKLRPLIEPFLNSSNKNDFIPIDHTIVWCPTSALHRVPIHAISHGDELLIQRNPIIYTQSLGLLHHSWKQASTMSPSSPGHRAIINPLDPSFDSSTVAKKLATSLGPVKALHGEKITQEQAIKTLQSSSLFNYLGHAEFHPGSPLLSCLRLQKRQQVTVLDILSSVKLHFPALCTLFACASGKTTITTTDDVLSLPTAFHYAGASSVLSTLWPVYELDAAAFAIRFYEKLINDTPDNQGSINLAKIMRDTMLEVCASASDEKKKQPFQWAGFFMQGLWRYPARSSTDPRPTSDTTPELPQQGRPGTTSIPQRMGIAADVTETSVTNEGDLSLSDTSGAHTK